MKYIEEMKSGQSFEHNGDTFVVSSDFKKNGHRLCISFKNGNSRWFGPSEIVESVDLYTIDKESNFISIEQGDADDSDKDI